MLPGQRHRRAVAKVIEPSSPDVEFE